MWSAETLIRLVCVEVLRPSQPNGVMSSAVSLPNHTFTGQALSSKRLTSIVHTLSPETDNCPSWISGRERMTVENISWSFSTKECCRPRRGLNPRPSGLQSNAHQTEPPRPAHTLYSILWFCLRTAKALIRLCGYTGLYWASMSESAWWHVYALCGLYTEEKRRPLSDHAGWL